MRATLEDAITNQELLLDKMDVLIAENRHVKDVEERKEMQKLLALSCLGLDWRTKFEVILSGRKISWPHLGYAVRRVSYWNSENEDNELKGLEPRDVWQSIRNNLFIVFSPALDKATSISKEVIAWKRDVPTGHE